MSTVTKKDLIEKIAARIGIKNQSAKQVVQMFLDEIIDVLAEGDRLEFREFGVFEPKRKKPRMARNPKTGADVYVDAKTVAIFKPGRLMRERVKNAPISEGKSLDGDLQSETSATGENADPDISQGISPASAPGT